MSVVYTTVNGRILRENRGGVVSHFVSDPLGSVVMVRDNSGNTVYEAEYDPYGNVQSETGTNPSEFGYVGTLGYVKDSAFSLYVRARYLLTNLGRWLTKDPLWPNEPGYVYAGAAPNMWADPNGRIPMTQQGLLVGASSAIVMAAYFKVIFFALAVIYAILGIYCLICWAAVSLVHPVCDNCGNCRNPRNESCASALQKALCLFVCVQLREFTQHACPQFTPGEYDHTTVTLDYRRAHERCLYTAIMKCGGNWARDQYYRLLREWLKFRKGLPWHF